MRNTQATVRRAHFRTRALSSVLELPQLAVSAQRALHVEPDLIGREWRPYCTCSRQLLALTGGAGPPSAFPLLKVDRQCCNGDSFSQADPKPTLGQSPDHPRLGLESGGVDLTWPSRFLDRN